MGHPTIENETPLAFSHLFTTDEDGVPLLVVIVKASLAFDAAGRVNLSEEQSEIEFAGRYQGVPGLSSYMFEPEGSFFKPAADVVLLGHAYPHRPGATECIVQLRVGDLRKSVHVVGDRFWLKGLGGTPTMTAARPFDKIALIYENAFGGLDEMAPAGHPQRFDPQNPVGTGYRLAWRPSEPPVRLPNMELADHRINQFADRPPPAGFGFLGNHWQPRAALPGS